MPAFPDFDPDNAEIISEEEAARALYRPSRSALELQRDFVNEQANEPDQSTFLERLALGANRGLSGLESTLGGIFNIAGLTDFGRVWQQEARERSANTDDISDTIAGQNRNPWYDVVENAGAIATQQVPLVGAAAFGGIPAAIAAAGLQTAGSVQDAAEQAYEARGLSRDEATRRARGPALASGATTSALTALMPGGTERLASQLFGGAESSAARQGVYQTAKRVFGEALKEAPEEALDQLAQDAVAHFSYDPDKPLGDILTDAWEAAGWGVGTGATVGTVGEGLNAAGRAANRFNGENFVESETHFPQQFADEIPIDPSLDFSALDEQPSTPSQGEQIAQRMREEQARPRSLRRVDFQPEIAFDPTLDFSEPAVEEAPPQTEPSLPPPPIDEPPVAPAAPAEPDDSIRRRLVENMQGRAMDITPEDFAQADAHLQAVLGEDSPTWKELSDAGLIEAEPQPNGTVRVRVAPAEAVVAKEIPTVAEAAQPVPETIAPEIVFAAGGDGGRQSALTSIPTVGTADTSTLPQVAQGSEIPNLIERSRLPEKVKRVTTALVNSPAMKGLDLSKLQVEITRPDTNGEITEVGARIGNLIELSEQADEKTFAHEVAHMLFDVLPPEVQQQIEKARVEDYTARTGSGLAADDRIASGQMTSDEFRTSGLSLDHYPLSNASEYLAHAFSSQFAQQALAKADPTLIGKLKAWLQEIYRTIKQSLGLGSNMDRIVQDLIDGKYAPSPDTGSKAQEMARQSTFAMSASEAQNAAELTTNRALEGESLSAQSVHIVDLLNRFGVGQATNRVKRAFDFNNWQGIANVGEQLLGQRADYRQLKAAQPDQFRRNRLAGEAGQQILRFGEQLELALAAGTRAFKELSGGHLRRLTAKVQAAALNAIAHDQILTVSKSVFNSAIADANKALKQERQTDIQIARLEGQIRGIREASESTVAMEQLLADMTATVMSTPAGQQALLTGQGGAREILSIYTDLKKSTGNSLHAENLLNWASYLLAKSPRLVNALHAANLAKQTGIRSQLTGMAKQFADDLTADPVKTIRRAMREREQQASNATGAKFVFEHLKRELLSEVEPLLADVDAGGIAAKIKADPSYQALRNEILNDQTSYGGKPAKPFKSATLEAADSTITLPSGRTIGIGHEVLDGNQSNLRARWDEFNAASEEIRNWLANPQNADDPTRRLHEANLQTLEDYYAGQQALMPENRDAIVSKAWSVINSAINKTSSRLTGSARAAVRKADQMHKWSRDWHDKWTHQLSESQRKAMQSHGIWRTGAGLVQSNREYQLKVGQELAASWQRQEGGFKVGETLSSGEVVTAEDLQHLELQSQAGFEALSLVSKFDRQITQDARGLKLGANYRQALRTSPYLVPRMFDYTLESQARAVEQAMKAVDPANPQTSVAFEQAMDRIWPLVGEAMLTDRNAEFAKKTVFDEKSLGLSPFQTVAQLNPLPQTINELAIALSQHSTASVDEAKAIVLEEFGRIVSQWSAAVQEKVANAQAGQGVKVGDSKNSFTQARGDALAPWVFYRTGFTTSDDVASHATGMMSVSMDRVIDALEALDKDLERQETEFKTRSNELSRQGSQNPAKEAVSEKERERKIGQTYDSWSNITGQRSQIQSALRRLKLQGAIESDFDYNFSRGTGALVGALIGNIVSTMKNLSPIFIGRQLRALGMSDTQALLRSLQFSSAESAKILGSFFVVGMPKAAGYLLRGLGRGVPQLMKGDIRTAYNAALRDVIREFAEDVPRRLQTVRELEAKGLYSLPEKVKEFDNQILGSLLYKGRIPSKEFQGLAKAFGYSAALFESTYLAVATAAFPTIGDAAVNGAMLAAMNHSAGPIQSMQTRLAKLYNDWKNNGYPRTFDLSNPRNPINRLAPSEVFGPRASNRENDLSTLRREYEQAGLSFDEEAAKFLADLEAGNPNAQFLSDDARLNLTDAAINQMNRSVIGNAPLWMKEPGTLGKFVKPLYGFNVRAFANWESSLSRPVISEKSASYLWLAAGASVALGLLATGAVGQLRDEAVSRMLKRILFNQESQNRLPWEEPTTSRSAATWTRLSMESVPLLGIIGNFLFPANSPARASYEPTLAVLEAVKAIFNYTHNAFAAGDPRFGLSDLAQKFIPDSKAVINRLDSQEGRRLAGNAVADIKRFAPPDLVRPPYKGGGGPSVTPMSPWLYRMENYAMTGDLASFRNAYNNAVAEARRLGKADPEKAVQNAFRSRDPEVRALSRRMTDGERAQMLRAAGGFGKDLSDQIREAQRRYEVAAGSIGIGLGRESGSQADRPAGPVRSLQRRPTTLRRQPGSLYRPPQQPRSLRRR